MRAVQHHKFQTVAFGVKKMYALEMYYRMALQCI